MALAAGWSPPGGSGSSVEARFSDTTRDLNMRNVVDQRKLKTLIRALEYWGFGPSMHAATPNESDDLEARDIARAAGRDDL